MPEKKLAEKKLAKKKNVQKENPNEVVLYDAQVMILDLASIFSERLHEQYNYSQEM